MTTDLAAIPIDQLVIHPDNPESRRRLDPELIESLRAGGQLQALLVEPAGDGRFLVIDGNRRLRHGRAAGRARMVCTVRARTNRIQHTLDRLSANGHRRDLAPIEEARDFGRLRDWGLTVAQIASRSGFAESRIRERLALLQLDDKTQQMVADGQLTLGGAREAIRSAIPTTHQTGRPRPRPTPIEYFGPTHPLATAAGQLCRTAHQRAPGRRYGGIACGEHWEAAIRADAAAAPAWAGVDVDAIVSSFDGAPETAQAGASS